MSADIDRDSFDPRASFSRLLHHQGAVLLASDLNQHGAIFQYYLRQFIIDLVGPHWRNGKGRFIITETSGTKTNFAISAGHFYVDGILCVNEVECWYALPKEKKQLQPMFPSPEWSQLKDHGLEAGFAVYIECHERHVNSIQRPAMREVALGGPDPSSRLEIAWQARVLTADLADAYAKLIKTALQKRSEPKAQVAEVDLKLISFKNSLNSGTLPCTAVQKFVDLLDRAEPELRVWAKKPADATDACTISPDAQYRGLENQLYRVEIHTSGVVDSGVVDSESVPPSCKWSRENGSVVFPVIPDSVKSTSTEFTLDLETLGPDRRYGLCVNDWVELTSDEIEFSQTDLPLAKIIKIDRSLRRLTLMAKVNDRFSGCTLLRRWDQKDGLISDEGTILIREATDNDFDSWIPLERGIKIQFQLGGNYRKGDYWLIPARVSSGDVVWPKEDGSPQSRSTDGIKRHRAAIGVVIKGESTNCGCVPGPICKES